MIKEHLNYEILFWLNTNFIHSRSESPASSTQSSPPISPGCEDQNMNESFTIDESFKRPMPPDLRHQNFQPLYNMYQPQFMLPNNSAFHRPDASGKLIPVRFGRLGFLITDIDWPFLLPTDTRVWPTSFKLGTYKTSRNFLS